MSDQIVQELNVCTAYIHDVLLKDVKSAKLLEEQIGTMKSTRLLEEPV